MTDEVQHDDPPQAAGPEDGGHAAPPAAEPELTILLYASDRTVRENVRFTLGRKVAADLPAVRVLEVATQPAVLTALDRGGVDLAILDGEAVPGGIGMCRQLKDDPETKRIPVVICTAKNRKEDLIAAIRAGAEDYIIKPFTKDIVLGKVQKALAARAALTSSTTRMSAPVERRVPAKPLV